MDTGVGRLVLMLGEKATINLWGLGPNREEFIVDSNDSTVMSVSEQPVFRDPVNMLFTYEVQGLKSGNAMLEARLFDKPPADIATRRQLWFTMPVWPYIQVSVLGTEYRMADARWGSLVYGSTKAAWRNVKWSNLAMAGCGPTSLAIVLDYLRRLDTAITQNSNGDPGIDPRDTKAYASTYGRSADANLEPAGTNGPEMVGNLDKYWPDFTGEEVFGVDEAIARLRQGHPLLFATNATTYKYTEHGKRDMHTWKNGHFMVILGVDNDEFTFWISDPSRHHSRFIDRDQLVKSRMWYVHKK